MSSQSQSNQSVENFLRVFILIVSVSVIKSNGDNIVARQVATSEIDMDILNAFSGCTIHVINFQGRDITFPTQPQPIILWRYISQYNEYYLYPIELKLNLNFLFEYTVKSFAPKFKTTRVITKNNTMSNIYEISKNYVRRIAGFKFRSSTKNSKCEANIYLNLPSFETEAYLYDDDMYLETIIKDPFWINSRTKTKPKYWDGNLVNTIPKYNLLICTINRYSNCKHSNQKSWIKTAMYERVIISIIQKIMVLTVLATLEKKLYVLCPYSEPLHPFKLTLADKIHERNPRELLDNYLNTIKCPLHNPQSIEVILLWYMGYHNDLVRKSRRHWSTFAILHYSKCLQYHVWQICT